ncbi:MAG: hypothetical protein MZV65_17940 [Chromatiales bacterium]|nr:hypothetical protein [Chromatiales bacterium]
MRPVHGTQPTADRLRRRQHHGLILVVIIGCRDPPGQRDFQCRSAARA